MESFLLPALTRGTSPSEILSCSFTRAAAGELRERLARATNRPADELRPTCSTIHSEALRRIRATGREVKILSGGRVKEEPEDSTGDATTAWAKDLVKEVDAEVVRVAQNVWHFARATCRRREIETVATELGATVSGDEIVHAIEEYEAAKRDKDVLDFTDLLEQALEAPAPPRALLIVDEVQDCSELQWRLIEHWARRAERVVFVGDPDQTIHEWCGAEYGRFEEAMSTCDLRRLTKSFRVPRILHLKARGVIRLVEDRVDAPYEPADAPGDYSVALTVDELTRKMRDARYDGAESTFILAPTSKRCVEWFRLCLMESIPARCERGGAPDPFAWSRKSLARALTALREGREASSVDVEHLIGELPVRGTGLFRGHKKAALERIAEIVKTRPVKLADAEAAGVNFEPLRAAATTLEAARIAKLDDDGFCALMRLVGRLGPALLDDAYRPPVTITTWHGSKGREADLVVADLARSRFVENDVAAGHRDRWLRAWYVVLTRARKSLITFDGALEHVIGFRSNDL